MRNYTQNMKTHRNNVSKALELIDEQRYKAFDDLVEKNNQFILFKQDFKKKLKNSNIKNKLKNKILDTYLEFIHTATTMYPNYKLKIKKKKLILNFKFFNLKIT